MSGGGAKGSGSNGSGRRSRGAKGDSGPGGVQLVKQAAIHQWESGAQYQGQQARQAEQRFKAREFEQRMTREKVKTLYRELRVFPVRRNGTAACIPRVCIQPHRVCLHVLCAQVRAARRKRDPERQAREAELSAMQQKLLEQRRRRKVRARVQLVAEVTVGGSRILVEA